MGDKFDKFIAKDFTIDLEDLEGNKETFTFKPLPFEMAGDIFKLMVEMQKAGVSPKDTEEQVGIKIMNVLKDGESFEMVKKLVITTLEISYPDQDKKKLQDFAMAKLWQLFPPIIQVNSLTQMSSKDRKKVQKEIDKGTPEETSG